MHTGMAQPSPELQGGKSSSNDLRRSLKTSEAKKAIQLVFCEAIHEVILGSKILGVYPVREIIGTTVSGRRGSVPVTTVIQRFVAD